MGIDRTIKTVERHDMRHNAPHETRVSASLSMRFMRCYRKMGSDLKCLFRFSRISQKRLANRAKRRYINV